MDLKNAHTISFQNGGRWGGGYGAWTLPATDLPFSFGPHFPKILGRLPPLAKRGVARGALRAGAAGVAGVAGAAGAAGGAFAGNATTRARAILAHQLFAIWKMQNISAQVLISQCEKCRKSALRC